MSKVNTAELTARFLNYFPGFRTFEMSGDRYKYQEDDYKRTASRLTHDLLDGWVNGQPDSLSPDELAKRIGTILRKSLPGLPEAQNLTGWRDNQFILDDLLSTNENREAFHRLLHPLLSKASTDENIDAQLTEVLEWLSDSGASAAATKYFPTLFLFFWNPDRFIFIKPRLFDGFLEEIGHERLGHGKSLTVGEYDRVLLAMRDLPNAIAELQPRDMIDLQSFYYVVMDYGDAQLPGYAVDNRPVELEELEAARSSYQHLDKTEREVVVSSRIGQGLFRANLIEYWRECAVTGCRNLNILVASHIKPWRDCSNEERLDINNGLLLVPNLDKLFDQGLVSFQDDGAILISAELDEDDLEKLNVNHQMRIGRNLSPEQREYLFYHRENILGS